jgi:hypothetical protein
LNVNRIVSKFAWIENIETTQIWRYAKKRGTEPGYSNIPLERKEPSQGVQVFFLVKKYLLN